MSSLCGRWLQHLPTPVRAAGAPGSQCCLFWPPPGAEVPGEGESLGGLWARLMRTPVVRSLRLALKVRTRSQLAFAGIYVHGDILKRTNVALSEMCPPRKCLTT